MSIPRTPFIIPATPEREFLASWVSNFRASTAGPGEGQLVFSLVPHNPDTGETLAQPETTYQGSLWELYANVPKAKAILDAVIDGTPDIIAYLEAMNQPNPDQP